MNTLIIAIGVFFVLLVLLIALRIITGNKFEIKTSDIVLALIPVALWLFLTGKIKELTLGELKIVSAIEEASNSPIASQVTKLPVQSVQIDPKVGTGGIPELIKKKSQALSFQLGHGGYWGPAIEEYLKVLTQYPFLRYIVINNSDGTFFGMADARQVAEVILRPGPGVPFDSQTFADWLNYSDKTQLETLPSFISSKNALNKESDKRRALQLMDSLDVQTLPVIDDASRYVGVVDRSKLTASILIDVTDRLESGR